MSDNPSAPSSSRRTVRFPKKPVTATLSYEPPEDVKSMFQPEDRTREGDESGQDLAAANFDPTTEKKTGERPKDLGASDPKMLSKARNRASNDEKTTKAIRAGDSKAGILASGKSSMGAASSAPSSAPNPLGPEGAASTSTTDVSLRRSARLIEKATERAAKRQRTERSPEQGDQSR
jgi:hypothetical protein